MIVIVSHKHKFIFLKTRKTAGTSIEMALRPHLGPEDISTAFLAQEEAAYQGPGPQNNLFPQPRPRLRTLADYLRHAFRGPDLINEHANAATVRSLVGEEVWFSYFKFCFERNPWDRQVSFYYFSTKRKGLEISFQDFVRSKKVRVKNWQIYTIDDRIVADCVFRYETLNEDMTTLWRRLSLPGRPELPWAKSDTRPKGEGYRTLYDSETRDIVGSLYRKEIDAFGYEF